MPAPPSKIHKSLLLYHHPLFRSIPLPVPLQTESFLRVIAPFLSSSQPGIDEFVQLSAYNRPMQSDKSEQIPSEVLIYDIESQNNQPPPELRDEPEQYHVGGGGDERQEDSIARTQVIRVKPAQKIELEEDDGEGEVGNRQRQKGSRKRRERRENDNLNGYDSPHSPPKDNQPIRIAQSCEYLLTTGQPPQSEKPQKVIPTRHPLPKKEEPESIIFYEQSLASSTTSLQVDQTTRGLLDKVCEDDSEGSDDSDYEEQEEDRVGELQPRPTKPSFSSGRVVPAQTVLPSRQILVQASPDLLLVNLVPRGYKLVLFLTIERGLLNLASTYRLFLGKEHTFLLAAKKEIFKYYSNFIISRHPHRIHTRKDCFGRLEGNFIGTSFKLYQRGRENRAGGQQMKGGGEVLRAVVDYHKNIVGFMGPRTFTVQKIDPETKPSKYHRDTLEEILESNEKSKLVCLKTELPVLVRGKYRLNFGGKVRVPSTKNFILEGVKQQKKRRTQREHEQEGGRRHQGQSKEGRMSQKEGRGRGYEKQREEGVILGRSLLFGKISDDCYRLQVSYPLTVFQAFGVCLSSLDRKLMVN